MEICITNARGRLTDLIRLAESGDEVVLTRNGVAVARLVPLRQGAAVQPGTCQREADAWREATPRLVAARS